MSVCTSTNVNPSVYTVIIENTNKQIEIAAANCNDTVEVTQPITNVITIVDVGPMGPAGPAGSSADVSALNAFTGSIQTQVDNLAAATSSYVLTSVTASMTVLSSSFAISASYINPAFINAYEIDPVFVARSASLATTGSNIFRGNQIISGNLAISGALSPVDYIDFYTNTQGFTHREGRIHWIDDTKTLEIDTDVANFMIEVGHQNVVRVRNATGYNLPIGKIVYINGELGNRPTVTTASWDSDPTSATTLGFVGQQINNNQNGYVITNGMLRGINTNNYSPGTQLYLSSSGNFTTTIPISPKHEVRLGKTITQAVNGTIYVDIMNGYELGELHDVLITSASNNDYIVRSGSLWVNQQLPVQTIYSNAPFTVFSGSVVTAETVIGYFQIPANTIEAGDVLVLKQRYNKTGTTSNITVRYRVNTTPSLSGGTLLGTLTQASTNRYGFFERHIAVLASTGGSNNNIYDDTTSIVSDVIANAVPPDNVGINWTQNQYILATYQLGSTADSATLIFLQGILYKKIV